MIALHMIVANPMRDIPSPINCWQSSRLCLGSRIGVLREIVAGLCG
jgi:hypothetical protein